jgi:branched-chain amino acid transport system substrate-binding protein
MADQIRDVHAWLGKAVTRRTALALAGGGVAALLAACGGQPASPTAAPKPTEAAKPAAEPTKPAAAAPTVAPTAAPAATKPAEPTKPAAAPAATPTTAPAAAATKPAAGTPDKIVIVSSLPRQGSNKGQTDAAVNAIKMAFKEVNYKVGSFTIEYLDWDDSSVAQQGNWDGNVERANAQKAVENPDVMAYIGTFNSGAAKISIPILNQANLVMISPANTYPGLTKPGKGEANEPQVYYPTGKRNYCRVVPADDIQGAVGAAWAKQLGAKKAYVLDDQQLYGKGLANVFADSAKKVGLEVVGREGIDIQAQDYRSLANKIKASGADMVYYGGITGNNAAKLWKDVRAALGPSAIMMGADGIFDEDFLKGAGDAAENTYVTFGGLPPKELKGKGKEFYDAYKKEYNNLEPEAYAVYSYEAAKVVIAGIQKAGKKDRDAIRQAVMSTKDFDGALGKWSFDDNGDTTLTDMSGSQAKKKDGKLEWSFVSTLQAPK